MLQQTESSTVIRCIAGLIIAAVAAHFNTHTHSPSQTRSAELAVQTPADTSCDPDKQLPSTPPPVTPEIPEDAPPVPAVPTVIAELTVPTDKPVSAVTETSRLSPDTQIAIQPHDLNEVSREIERTTLQISKAKQKLATAQFDERNLPDKIKRLSDSIARLDMELSAAAGLTRTAKSDLANFRSTLPIRKQRTQQQANSTREAGYENSVAKLTREQQERNEQRVRIGAQHQDQEEALRLRRDKQKAKQAADAAYLRTLELEETAITAESEACSQKVAAAEEAYWRYSAARQTAIKELADVEATLAVAPIATASIPAELASLEAELRRLVSLKEPIEAKLRIARQEQLERNRELALARARQVEASRLERKASVRTAPVVSLARVPNNYWSNLQNSNRIPNTPQGRSDWNMLRSGYNDFAISSASSSKPVHVRSYHRKDGTYVQSHWRSYPSR